MKVIVYEDEPLLRQSLSMLIDSTEGFQVVGSFPHCGQVEEEVARLAPDVVLMDIEMPQVDGMEGVKRIKAKYPSVKVIMHTIFDDNEKLFACLKAGADGYLLKRTPPAELLQALERVVTRGDAPMSPAIARRVLETFHDMGPGKNEYGLSDREKEVLHLLVEGHTYKSMAAYLGISVWTITSHLQSCYRKLHVNCASQAVVKAIREELI